MRFHGRQTFPFLDHRFSTGHLGALPTLTMNRLFGAASTAIVGLFFSIFLYEFFDYSITMVLLWFLVSYTVRIPIQVLAAKVFSRTGLVPSMVIGTCGAIVYYLSLYFLDTQALLAPWLFLTLAILGLSFLMGFYWTPFHIDFAEFTNRKKRGTQLSFYLAIRRVIGVVSPIIGGFLIAEYGYSVIFIYAIIVLLLSFIPLAHLPRTFVKYEFGFFETFQKMTQKEFRPLTIAMMAYGAENIVGIIIWPIFLFTIFNGEYLQIGAFAAVIVVISILIQFVVGKQIDHKKSRKLLRWGSEVYALGWFFKSLVDTVFGVFAASTFHSLGAIMLYTPMDAIYYERAADSGHYVDEFTVIRETAMSIGRVLMVLILIGVTAAISLQSAFIVAAIVSLGVSLLSNLHAKSL